MPEQGSPGEQGHRDAASGEARLCPAMRLAHPLKHSIAARCKQPAYLHRPAGPLSSWRGCEGSRALRAAYVALREKARALNLLTVRLRCAHPGDAEQLRMWQGLQDLEEHFFGQVLEGKRIPFCLKGSDCHGWSCASQQIAPPCSLPCVPARLCFESVFTEFNGFVRCIVFLSTCFGTVLCLGDASSRW